MPVDVVHHGSGGEQSTTLRVTLEDATGETSTYEFTGAPGGPYSFAGEGEPTEAALEEVFEHVDDPDAIAHDAPGSTEFQPADGLDVGAEADADDGEEGE